MEIRTLENTSTAEITNAFNEAFSDYIVKLQLSEEQLKNKIKSENIKPELSFGAFEKGKLVGFILNGIDRYENSNVIYNGGTGVIPKFRGQRITEQIYRYANEVLGKQNIYKHQLEVITTNEKAFKVYEKLGFNITRNFNCYKGKVTSAPDLNYYIEVAPSIDLSLVSAFWESMPSWQNSTQSVERLLDKLTVVKVKHENELIGYSIFMKETGRVQQIAVKKEFRKQGIGKALLYKMNEIAVTPELTFINVDAEDTTLNSFFASVGFINFINLYEMKLEFATN